MAFDDDSHDYNDLRPYAFEYEIEEDAAWADPFVLGVLGAMVVIAVVMAVGWWLDHSTVFDTVAKFIDKGML